MTKITQEQLNDYTIKASDFVSCAQAFIDCRTPGSDKKENYSMIGPGVTQSDEQFVNVAERHGFNIGAAAMPKECINNLHIHFTAETFYLHRGDWEFKWGNRGENTVTLTTGAIFSPRTWLFRGFRNVGADDGFVFTVLGGDDTGGIIWHPEVLNEAKKYGLVLTAENKVLDTVANADVDVDEVELIQGVTEEQMATLRQPSTEEMMKQVVTFEELDWSEDALLCAKTDGGKVRMAPAIGWGMTEYRDHTPKIYNPHGYSVEWLEIPIGQSVKLHRIAQRQVLKMHQGTIEVSVNRPEEGQVSNTISAKDVLSVPASAWRTLTNIGSETAFVLVVNGSDSVNRIQWDTSVISEARENGFGLDTSGYIALEALIRYSNPMLDGFVQC